MILVPRRNLYLPRRFWPSDKEKQRGSIMLAAAAQAGLVSCTAGTSTIPDLDDVETTPTNAEVGAKWDTDGGVYYYDKTTTPDNAFPGSANGGTWQGPCANSDYEGRWTDNNADAPTSSEPAKDVWRAMNVGDVRVEYATSGVETLNATFTFELRRVSDQVTILTDTFMMDVDEDVP